MADANVGRGWSASIPLGTLAEVGAELAARPYARRGVTAAEVAIRIMLVDDHDIVRSGVKALLRTWPDLLVVAEAAGGEEAVRTALRVHRLIDAIMASGREGRRVEVAG